MWDATLQDAAYYPTMIYLLCYLHSSYFLRHGNRQLILYCHRVISLSLLRRRRLHYICVVRSFERFEVPVWAIATAHGIGALGYLAQWIAAMMQTVRQSRTPAEAMNAMQPSS